SPADRAATGGTPVQTRPPAIQARQPDLRKVPPPPPPPPPRAAVPPPPAPKPPLKSPVRGLVIKGLAVLILAGVSIALGAAVALPGKKKHPPAADSPAASATHKDPNRESEQPPSPAATTGQQDSEEPANRPTPAVPSAFDTPAVKPQLPAGASYDLS